MVAARLKVLAEQVSNAASGEISLEEPFIATLTIEGTAALLFHRYDPDAVAEKKNAKKGSAAKNNDNIESYVYRSDSGELCLPGEYLRQAVVHAAKFEQDPRSPRKSAMDLFKAGVQSLTDLAGLGVHEWEYEDRRRAVIGRNAISRIRPAFRPGWNATIQLMSVTPEYISPAFLRRVIDNAGRLVGVGDFRPTFGRFVVTSWEIE